MPSKKYRLLVTAGAKNEIKEAKVYYKKQQAGLEKRFLKAVKARLTLLQKQPFSAQVRLEKEGKGIRGVLIETFPFIIYYLPDQAAQTIVVLSVLHTRKNTEDTIEL